jgi:membrane-associated phospholipid phosphatase
VPARRAALILLLVPLASAAEGPDPIRHDTGRDAALTAVAVAAWGTSELAKPALAPRRCRLCEPGRLDAAARARAVSASPDRAARASDVLAFALVPAGVAAHQLLAARNAGDADAGLTDLLVVAEAASFSAVLNQLVKYTVGRERPFVHYRNFRDADRRPDPDDHLSFYSGHTTLAFAIATAAGTVSDLRGYDGAPWVFGAGLAAAASVGWLRMAADRHYLTDVLAGAVAGTAIGVAVPRLLHGREREPGGAGASAPLQLGLAVAF